MLLRRLAFPRLCEGDTGRTCGASHCQEEILHLRGEFPTLGFLLGKAYQPVEERAKKTGYDEAVQILELGCAGLASLQH